MAPTPLQRAKRAIQIIDYVIGRMTPKENFQKQVLRVMYREDYQDYRVVFDDKTYCELREKLINDAEKFLPVDETPTPTEVRYLKDVEKEIRFRLFHAVALEDWEDDPTELPKGETEV